MAEPRDVAVRLVIELYGMDEPIQGALIEPELHASPFRGWLALTALIDAARDTGAAHENSPRAGPGC